MIQSLQSYKYIQNQKAKIVHIWRDSSLSQRRALLALQIEANDAHLSMFFFQKSQTPILEVNE